MKTAKHQLLLTLFIVVFVNIVGQAQNCKPVVTYYVNRMASAELHINNPDTLDVFIACLENCHIIAEAEGVQVTELGRGKFLMTALSPGEKKVNFFADCPKGKKLTVDGKKQDMSGRKLVVEERFTSVE